MMKLNIQMFASTNKTANYELPQFVGTDKPTWLGDFNGAMSAIDAGMAENKSDIESMDSRVTSAESTASQASQNVATLTGRVATVESGVSSATSTANNAQQTATSALNTANTAQTTANTADSKADTNATNIASIQEELTVISAGEAYSTTEVKTTKVWVNGKSIYRKVFDFTTPSSNVTSWTTIASISNLDLDDVIRLDGTYEEGTTGNFHPINYYESSSTYCDVMVLGSNIVYKKSTPATLAFHLKITMEYTKASD